MTTEMLQAAAASNQWWAIGPEMILACSALVLLAAEIVSIVDDWRARRPWFVAHRTPLTNQWVLPTEGLVRACLLLGREDLDHPVDALAAGVPVEPLARYFEYWLLRLQGVYPTQIASLSDETVAAHPASGRAADDGERDVVVGRGVRHDLEQDPALDLDSIAWQPGITPPTLRGAADADRDGAISYGELGAFLKTANAAIPSPGPGARPPWP